MSVSLTTAPVPDVTKGTYYSKLKGQILKHANANFEKGFDYIELKIPFIVTILSCTNFRRSVKAEALRLVRFVC